MFSFKFKTNACKNQAATTRVTAFTFPPDKNVLIVYAIMQQI